MSEDYPQAIARILKQENRQVAAMGFLITDRHLLTCAHVVNTALGLEEASQDQPLDEVEAVFSVDDGCLSRFGHVIFWRPIDRTKTKREADIAVLELDQSLPASVSPLKMRARSLDDSVWQAFGCPGEDGYWSKGTFRDPDFRLRRQMMPTSEDSSVQKGFSGSPVFITEEKEHAVGMVTAIFPQHGNRAAFMLPNEILLNAIVTADIAVLSQYLFDSNQILWQTMKQIYPQCLPDVWFQEEPQSFEAMLQILAKDVPGDNDSNGHHYSALSQFIGGLLVSNQLNSTEEINLRHWLNLKVDKVQKLLDFVQQNNKTRIQSSSEASLLIQLKQSQKDNLKKFQVEAWLIPDSTQYDYEKTQGYQELSVSDDVEQTFSLKEVPALISDCLNQAAGENDAVNDPMLEVFLPLDQLNEVVEDWNLPDDNPFADLDSEPNPLGWRYRVVLRSTDRASDAYAKKYPRYLGEWKQRWKNVEVLFQSGALARDSMIDGSDPIDQRPLKQRLTPLNVLGVKLCPMQEFQDITVALQKAIPIAIWVRNPIPNAKTLLNRLLGCCFHEVPLQTLAQRSAACNPTTDLGCHLGLLWDNPNLRPPKPPNSR